MKNLSKICALLFVLALASSCNKRGMGCPDAFELKEPAIPVLQYIK